MLYNKRYSLKRMLLNEALIMPIEFFDRLENVLAKNKRMSGKYGSIFIDVIQKSRDEEERKVLSKKKKKPVGRSSYVTKMIKNNEEIRSIDNQPIDISVFSPLFEPMIRFLDTNADVSFEECLKASDFFARQYSKSAIRLRKISFKEGEIDFSIVLETVRFYERFKDSDTGLESLGRIASEDVDVVYEDEDLLIMYPVSSKSFLNTISEYVGKNKAQLTWCTQNPTTWYKYTYFEKQYVMIAMDKRSQSVSDNNYIISLKVDLNGKIKHEDTCDRYNSHMTYESVEAVLNENAKQAISEYSALNRESIVRVTSTKNNVVEPEVVLENISSLYKMGKIDQIRDIIFAVLYLSVDDGDYKVPDDELTEYYDNLAVRKENAIKILKGFSQLDFGDDEDIEERDQKIIGLISELVSDTSFLLDGHSRNEVSKMILSSIDEDDTKSVADALKAKALQSRSHPRYYKAIICNSEISKEANPTKEEALQMFETFASTRNTANFFSVLEEYNKNSKKTRKFQVDPSVLIRSSGFKNYIATHKENFFTNFFDSYSEDYIIKMIEENSDTFDEIIKEVLEPGSFGINEYSIILKTFLFNIQHSEGINLQKYRGILSNLSFEKAENLHRTILVSKENFMLFKDSFTNLQEYALFIKAIYNSATKQKSYPISGETFLILKELIKMMLSFESNIGRIDDEMKNFVYTLSVSYSMSTSLDRVNAEYFGDFLFEISRVLGKSINDFEDALIEPLIVYDIFSSFGGKNRGFTRFFRQRICKINPRRKELYDLNNRMFEKHVVSNNNAKEVIASSCLEAIIKFVDSYYNTVDTDSETEFKRNVLVSYSSIPQINSIINRKVMNNEVFISSSREIEDSTSASSVDMFKNLTGTKIWGNIILANLCIGLELFNKTSINYAIKVFFETLLGRRNTGRNLGRDKEEAKNSLIRIIKGLDDEMTIFDILYTFEKYLSDGAYRGKSGAYEVITLFIDIFEKAITSNEDVVELENLLVLISNTISDKLQNGELNKVLYLMAKHGENLIEKSIAQYVLSCKNSKFKASAIRFLEMLRTQNSSQYDAILKMLPESYGNIDDALERARNSQASDLGSRPRRERVRKRLMRNDSVNESREIKILRNFIKGILK